MSSEQDSQDASFLNKLNGESTGEAGAGDASGGYNDGAAAAEGGAETSEYIATEARKPALSRTTLIMFSVIALGAAGVWVMYQRVGPGKAAAAPSPESVQAKKTIHAFLDGGGSNIKSMETMLRSTEKVVQQFLSYPSMTQVPLSDLRTNPFRLRAARPDNAPLDDITERRKKEEERVAMLKSVQSLRLQSIMYSDARKACMINDTMYREGDVVDAFTIEKVTVNSVVVKGGVYRFELRMQR